MTAHAPIFSQRGERVEINEREFVFYPTRLSMILKLRKFSEEIAEGLMGVMAKDPSHYAGKTFREGNTEINDVSQEKIDKFTQAKTEGIKKLVSSLTEEKNMRLLCDLVCDSLREEELTSDQLMNESDAETFVAMAFGLFQANSSILDPIMGGLQKNQEAEGPQSAPEMPSSLDPSGNTSKTASLS